LRREIERHICLTPFLFNVDFASVAVNAGTGRGPRFACFRQARWKADPGEGLPPSAVFLQSPGRAQPLRVLIVDDHPIIISGCRALLETDPSVEVFEAQDGATGFAAFFDSTPDVALIDINLPGLSGLELLSRILQRAPEARLIIFSMNDDPVVAARAIEAGAKGYIAKNDDPTLFADAVRAVANGGLYLHPEMARQVAFLRAGANAISSLSPRELEILRLLAAGHTMAQIADLLNVSYKTVANNCTQLKQKLGARTAMDLMRIALGVKI
jgi:two-component system, NarL family, invasion response regulator UvrY